MTHPLVARRVGFTLVELMVAMALMMILTGSVVFIFIQAQKIFLTVDARVQVYQYARYAFDQMERDFANVVRSSDMEFYDDLPPPNGRQGRFDSGEEIPISGARDNPSIYNHAFTVRQPDLYTGQDGERYRNDSVYFKTVTVAGGQTTAALIEYVLVDTDRERPKLVKRMWRVTGIDATTPTRPKYQINGTIGSNAQPVVQDLCLYTTDVRFELFVRNRRLDQVGEFYDAQTLVKPPRLNPGNRLPFPAHLNDWIPPDYMVQTYYDGCGTGPHVRDEVLYAQPDPGMFVPSENKLFRTKNYFPFPMLKEGDRIYMWGGNLPIAREYTIDSFRKPDGSLWTSRDPIEALRIKFKEPPPDWPQSLPPSQPLEVNWDANWLPPAIRVTLRIKDAKSLETRSVQRVFKVLTN